MQNLSLSLIKVIGNMLENPTDLLLTLSFTRQQNEEQEVHTLDSAATQHTVDLSSLRACVYLYRYQAISSYCMNCKGKKMKA